MTSRKNVRAREENSAVLEGINALRDEIKRLRKGTEEEKKRKEDDMEVVLDVTPLETEVEKLKEEIRELNEKVKEIKTFMLDYAMGARAFFNQQKIKETMLELDTPDAWKKKSIEELAWGLSTAQLQLNEEQSFEAARELQGFIEITEAAREVILVTPTATSWIKKGLEEATGAVLRHGRERKGQALLWTCLQKHLTKKFAEREKEIIQMKGKNTEPPPKTNKAEFPCANCVKAGRPNQMHTLAECARFGNTCLLECRNCPIEPGSSEGPCHWREKCPYLRKRERSSGSKTGGAGR